jgi:hypothetical protein
MKWLLLCLAVILVCGGCRYNPYARLYTTEKPRSQDVVGRYRLTRQTVTGEGLSALNGRTSVVELLPDGRFHAANLPPRRLPIADRSVFSKLLSGSGNWRIGICGRVDSGLGRERSAWGIYLESPGAEIEVANLTGAKPPYSLILTIGDPDTGQVMMFERQN